MHDWNVSRNLKLITDYRSFYLNKTGVNVNKLLFCVGKFVNNN